MSFDERAVVARIRRLTLRELRLWVRKGWVRPAQSERGPVFDDIDVARLRLLCDLRKEMALPTDVMPTVLTLIDQLHRTRRDLRRLAEALDEQPDHVRRAVITSVRRRAGDGN
ncbi:MAG: MerR family transcriptional regulator [Rhodobacteraceae bacterium]|nr:chaperone modulator CbpM [Alphaproteobacteria bacterium]MBT8473871.1 chaperone modulator CbpM [Alphaproteobacteria bacterium]NNK68632.1 MerR family transcriptional regulator [Paracoccaceae bacterium]